MRLVKEHFAGIVYRAHNPRWSLTPLSGNGAARHGGRFNPIGMPALYTSFKPRTAILEASPLGRALQPLTLVAYQVDAGPLFDARDANLLKKRGFQPNDLANADWEDRMLDGHEPVQHRFARAVQSVGYVGVVAPSFARGAGAGDVNLVFWQWAATGRSVVTMIDDEGRLTRDDAN